MSTVLFKKIRKTALDKIAKKSNYKDLIESIEKKSVLGRYGLNVQIQTTSSCNGKCIICPYPGSWHQKNPGRMSWNIYKKIITDLTKFKIAKFCPYLENEPLIDKDIFNKIRYALKELDMEVLELSTNASLFTDDILEEIANVFPSVKHEIWISFHGISRESYENIMGLDFERALNNTLKLVELSQKVPLRIVIRGAGSPKLRNLDSKTWFDEREYLSFWKRHLTFFKKQPLVRFIKYHDRAGALQLKDKGIINLDGFSRESLDGFYCVRFDRWAHFLYTGEPILCCMDYNRETAFNESISNKTIEELFSSSYFLELLKKGTGIIESGDDFICKRCFSPGG